jgi:hypothetical protein
MIKLLARRALRSFSKRYEYDTGYMEAILDRDPGAFLKFALVSIPAAHRRAIPAAPWWAARIRAALWEDCGPCVQLVCNMALEAGVEATTVAAIPALELSALDDETALAVKFTEAVLARDAAADALREQVRQRWGEQGLVSLALAISLSRVYPSVKYALGHGHSCSLLRIAQHRVAPASFAWTTMPVSTPGGSGR